jgi:hypothetical protein
MSFKALSSQPGRRMMWLLKGWIIVSSFSPLLMNFLGWDVYRWWAFVPLNTFLILMTVYRAGGPATGAWFDPIWRNAGILLICLNIASGVGLLDNYVVNNVPYNILWQKTTDVFSHHRLTLPLH